MIVTEGAITDRPLPRTFAAIAARGFTGELIVTSAGREHRVAWRDGGVVGATSPHPADGAAKIAVTLGVLSSTQAGEVTRIIAANPHHRKTSTERATPDKATLHTLERKALP